MTLVCPICKSVAQEPDRIGDATGFYCATHSGFKVADTLFAELSAKEYTRQQWELALRNAKRGGRSQGNGLLSGGGTLTGNRESATPMKRLFCLVLSSAQFWFGD
jgi:hypothetical protein